MNGSDIQDLISFMLISDSRHQQDGAVALSFVSQLQVQTEMLCATLQSQQNFHDVTVSEETVCLSLKQSLWPGGHETLVDQV